jgi:hypothetical protein
VRQSPFYFICSLLDDVFSTVAFFVGQVLDACQAFQTSDTSNFPPSCLPTVDAVEGVEDYISMAVLHDLSNGAVHFVYFLDCFRHSPD